MNYSTYNLINNLGNTKFSLVSSGSKGDIELAILFTPLGDGLYNLALGRIISETEIDDLAVVNNGDRYKILATVVQAALSFFDSYPQAVIYFSGSTEARIRLYKRVISLNLNELEQTF